MTYGDGGCVSKKELTKIPFNRNWMIAARMIQLIFAAFAFDRAVL